ncbi:MAG: hypothetical protein ACKO70_11220 [Actinomycetota bacterium]
MIDVEALRADTPGCAGVTHLNNAGSALPPRVVTDTMVEHLRQEEIVGGYEAHAQARDRVASVYASVGELVRAPIDRIALVGSATVDVEALGHMLDDDVRIVSVNHAHSCRDTGRWTEYAASRLAR